MSEHSSEDEHIFTVRLWREPSADGPSEADWRGRLYHSQSKSSWNFVGQEMLFGLIRKALSGGAARAVPPLERHH